MPQSRFLLGTASVVAILSCGALTAQSAPDDLPLDALLNTRISTAAKYEQRVTDVPASVTVITAEEISRNGWHTLAEALASVRGVTLTYDRGYTYLGVRGVGLPTDYNNRFLILLDGQPMVEGVSGSIDTGTALAISLSSLARIELVRGPGSVLYGSGAMFGVINLVLKSEQESASVTLGEGSHHTTIASGRFAHTLGGGFSMSIVGAMQNDQGQKLYFRDFDTPENNNGINVGHDFDNYRSLLGTLTGHGMRFLAFTSSRTKGIPTSWYGTTFNGNARFTDGRDLLGLSAEHRFSPTGQMFLRTSYDRFDYHGQFPYGPDSYTDRSSSTRLNADLRYVWDVKPNHRITLGSEYVDSPTATYRYAIAGNRYAIGGPFAVGSLYVQSEYQPFHALSVTAGVRYDHYAHVTAATNPRGAVVWHLNNSNTFKVLYGSAFRLPTVFELGFEDASQNVVRSQNLGPERIRQLELVWEGRLTPELLVSISPYKLQMTDLIKEQTDAATGQSQFQNATDVVADGVEVQADYRRSDGLWSYASYSIQHAEEEGMRMVNSPAHLAKAGISTPTSRAFHAALEFQYESGRKTFGGHETGSSLLTNLSLSAALRPSMRVSVTVKNLMNTTYATPGGTHHPEDTIPQNGRTILVRLRVGG